MGRLMAEFRRQNSHHRQFPVSTSLPALTTSETTTYDVIFFRLAGRGNRPRYGSHDDETGQQKSRLLLKAVVELGQHFVGRIQQRES